MKKRILTALNVAVSCLLSVIVLFLLQIIGSGSPSAIKAPVEFSENGDILHFFGETLYISRDEVAGIMSYPSNALEFCAEFLPNSVIAPAKSLAVSVASNCRAFVSLVFGAIDSFLTLGTSL